MLHTTRTRKRVLSFVAGLTVLTGAAACERVTGPEFERLVDRARGSGVPDTAGFWLLGFSREYEFLNLLERAGAIRVEVRLAGVPVEYRAFAVEWIGDDTTGQRVLQERTLILWRPAGTLAPRLWGRQPEMFKLTMQAAPRALTLLGRGPEELWMMKHLPPTPPLPTDSAPESLLSQERPFGILRGFTRDLRSTWDAVSGHADVIPIQGTEAPCEFLKPDPARRPGWGRDNPICLRRDFEVNVRATLWRVLEAGESTYGWRPEEWDGPASDLEIRIPQVPGLELRHLVRPSKPPAAVAR
jgi:hypothetical protein